MTRTALALLLTVAPLALAEDKQPVGQPIVEVKLDKGDKLDVKFGKWNEPAKVTSAEELEKLIADKAIREKITKGMDLKTHDLLVFAWKGSGRDQLNYRVAESFPEQIFFGLKAGETDDLRSHAKLFAVRKNVRWSAK